MTIILTCTTADGEWRRCRIEEPDEAKIGGAALDIQRLWWEQRTQQLGVYLMLEQAAERDGYKGAWPRVIAAYRADSLVADPNALRTAALDLWRTYQRCGEQPPKTLTLTPIGFGVPPAGDRVVLEP